MLVYSWDPSCLRKCLQGVKVFKVKSVVQSPSPFFPNILNTSVYFSQTQADNLRPWKKAVPCSAVHDYSYQNAVSQNLTPILLKTEHKQGKTVKM